MDAAEYGKSELSDMMEDELEDDGRDTLFFHNSRFGETVRGGVVSSGQGICRLCTLPPIHGTTNCGVSSHPV
jgi:hypothetical protein